MTETEEQTHVMPGKLTDTLEQLPHLSHALSVDRRHLCARISVSIRILISVLSTTSSSSRGKELGDQHSGLGTASAGPDAMTDVRRHNHHPGLRANPTALTCREPERIDLDFDKGVVGVRGTLTSG